MNVANLFNPAQSLLCGNRIYCAVPKKSIYSWNFHRRISWPSLQFFCPRELLMMFILHTLCKHLEAYHMPIQTDFDTDFSAAVITIKPYIYMWNFFFLGHQRVIWFIHSLITRQQRVSVTFSGSVTTCTGLSQRMCFIPPSLFILYTNIYRSILWLLG